MRWRILAALIGAITVAVAGLTVSAPAFAAGADGETTLGNNLSVPAVFVPDVTALGAPVLRVPCGAAVVPSGPESTQYPGYWLPGRTA